MGYQFEHQHASQLREGRFDTPSEHTIAQSMRSVEAELIVAGYGIKVA
jgi:hypothetical protein